MYFLLNMGIFQPAMLVYQGAHVPWDVHSIDFDVVFYRSGESTPMIFLRFGFCLQPKP